MYAQKQEAQIEDSNPLKKQKRKSIHTEPSDESGHMKNKKTTCDVTAKNQPVPKKYNEKTDTPTTKKAPKKTDTSKAQIKDPDEEKERQAYHHTCNMQLTLCSHV